jgi:hypothetical protein
MKTNIFIVVATIILMLAVGIINAIILHSNDTKQSVSAKGQTIFTGDNAKEQCILGANALTPVTTVTKCKFENDDMHLIKSCVTQNGPSIIRIPSCVKSELCDGSGNVCMPVWTLDLNKRGPIEHVRVAGIYNGKVISEFMDLNQTEQEELMDAGLYIEHFGMEWEWAK